MLKFRAQVPNSFSLPRRIHGLADLAYNLWWTWNPDVQRLFSRIDPDLWEQTYHNPVKFLRQVQRARLNAAMNNRYYLDFYDRMLRSYEQYLQTEDTWFARTCPELKDRLIAYFSMEFGLHENSSNLCGRIGGAVRGSYERS